ncbi:DMT family transporter [Pseudooceanicola sp. C21-150M6]|uniref:DMT family transporter n=1 Tax=Pseudooceanicola sp. C21-150M6 TaxID=3434355 RepID=UPI003D7F6B83
MTQALRGHLAMLLFSFIVAGSFSLGALAAPFIAPAALNALRFVIAAVLVGVVALATTGIDRSALRAPWRYLLMGGVFGTYFVLMFQGLKTADPVAAAAVFTLVPVMAAVFGWLLLRQRTTGRMIGALAIGATGAMWVIFRGDLAAFLRFQIGHGEWIYFWGCVAHALYTPLVPRLNRGEPPVVFTFGMLCGAVVMVGAYGFGDILGTDWLALPGIVWITILYIAVLSSAVSFVLMQYASLRLPSAKVMAYTYLVPSWVILWEAGWGRGLPPPFILLGVAITILALVLLLKDEHA